MKKLLFILSAVFVSTLTYSGVDDWNQPNPFAYDLKSEVIENGTQLKLTYSLNATAVTSDTYNEDHHGLQIYLIDENGNRIKKEDGTTWACTSGSYQKGKDHSVIIPVADLPPAAKDKLVSWEVVVHENKNRTQPKVVYTDIKTDNSVYYPRAAHGIAVGKNPDKPNFAKLFTAEASTNTLNGKSVPNSLWEYNMQMKYQKYHHKDILDGGTSHFSATTNTEPHRVKISDDGRIFATCYHETAISAVVEYIGNGEWKTVVVADIERNGYQDEVLYPKDDKYNRRPIAMDVKGSGDNLKILVAWMKPKGKKINNNGKDDRMHAQIQVIEYEVGSNNYNIDQDNGTVVAEYIDHDTEGLQDGKYDGMLFQSYYYGYNQALHGFIGVAYGDDNSIWLKVDFGFGISDGRRSHILRYDQGSKEAKYTYTFPSEDKYRHTTGGYYGGAGILIKGNQLITGSGSNTLLVYTIKNDKTLDTNESNVKSYGCGSPGTSTWLDAIAEDYAGNLYCISEAADNVVIFAMPYDGTRTTRANTTFTVSDPIPNILATDLRFAPVPNQPKYRFSFNVNTTPKSAQIRFYKSYGDGGENDMKKNLAKINADDYQGGDAITPSFVYNIPNKFLNQGEIAVEFDMVGGEVVDGVLNDAALPRGEWYWSVYVEAPRKSTVFAPIYKQGSTGEDTHCRLHATINNYPETDQFGWIIAAQYDTRAGSAKKGLMLYGFNPTGNSNDEQSTINNSVRYKLIKEYINPTTGTNKFENQRRLAVAPDGKVFIADYGNTNNNTRPLSSVMPFKNGGIWLWDPAKQSESSNTINLSLFLNSTTETANGLAIYKDYNDETKIKLYGTNTYGEFEYHGTYYEEAAQAVNGIFGKNGIKEYELGKPENIYQKETQNTITRQLGAGDGNGNISIVTMDKGIWIAQHRLNDVQYALDQFTSGKEANLALPDNPFNYILSFVPYNSSTRTWTSCSSNGVSFSASNRTYEFKADVSDLTQKTASPLQSCPGAGLAYRKITAGSQKGEYLYIVNHEGNIVELQITSWNGNKPTVVYKKTLPSAGNKTAITGTTRETGAISTINFDYAGNLITTSGTGYLGDASQDIIVYTMPYDRKNAREIQAPNSCRKIVERLSYIEDNTNMDAVIAPYLPTGPKAGPCYVDLYRPMPNTSFSTICLPFDLDITKITEKEPYYNAEFKKFDNAQVRDFGGEKMLELEFVDIPTSDDGKQILEANQPYIVKPQNRIAGIIELEQPIQFKAISPITDTHQFNDGETGNNSISFTGVIPTVYINTENTLLLVAENRLAEMLPDAGFTNQGKIHGFRGYFKLGAPLPQGMQAILRNKDNTVTGLVDINGKKVNIEKYLREGRVYIRVGESLYTIDGQLVK